MNTQTPEDHAVVIGGSVAGLLAARALSETFSQVTVVDKDEMPTQPVHRKGVPQSRHTHGLLAKGFEIIEELLPGFGFYLIARGALANDVQKVANFRSAGAARDAAHALAGLEGPTGRRGPPVTRWPFLSPSIAAATPRPRGSSFAVR